LCLLVEIVFHSMAVYTVLFIPSFREDLKLKRVVKQALALLEKGKM